MNASIRLLLPNSPEPESARHARSSEPSRYGRYLDWCEHLQAHAPTQADDDAAFAWFMREDAPC